MGRTAVSGVWQCQGSVRLRGVASTGLSCAATSMSKGPLAKREQLLAQGDPAVGQGVFHPGGTATERCALDIPLGFQEPQGPGEHAAADPLDGTVEFVEAVCMLSQQSDDYRAPLVADAAQHACHRAPLALLLGNDLLRDGHPVAGGSGAGRTGGTRRGHRRLGSGAPHPECLTGSELVVAEALYRRVVRDSLDPSVLRRTSA